MSDTRIGWEHSIPRFSGIEPSLCLCTAAATAAAFISMLSHQGNTNGSCHWAATDLSENVEKVNRGNGLVVVPR